MSEAPFAAWNSALLAVRAAIGRTPARRAEPRREHREGGGRGDHPRQARGGRAAGAGPIDEAPRRDPRQRGHDRADRQEEAHAAGPSPSPRARWKGPTTSVAMSTAAASALVASGARSAGSPTSEPRPTLASRSAGRDRASARVTRPAGTSARKGALHPRAESRSPPSPGPSAVPVAEAAPRSPSALPARAPAASRARAVVRANIAAAPSPWSARAAIRSPSPGASPHRSEAAVKSVTPEEEQAAATDEIAQPAGHDEQRRDGHEVDQHDPLRLLERRREALRQDRHGHGGAARGEGGQEHREPEPLERSARRRRLHRHLTPVNVGLSHGRR
jgi:hypothetical protein